MNNIRQRKHAFCLSIGILLAGLVFQPSAQAHQQWLAPNFFFESADRAWLTFDHTFSDRRFQSASGPSSYYRWWVVSPDGLKTAVPSLFLGKTRTVGEVELTEPGTYRLEAEEDMMAWTQLKVDGETRWQPGTRESFAHREIVGSRTFFNRAIAYVTLGAPNAAVLAPTGDPLEIVFEDHPNEITAGTAFRLRVLSHGDATKDQVIEVHAEGGSGHDDAMISCTTDPEGACALTLTSPGRYLLATSAEGKYGEASPTDGYAYGVTVMIEAAHPDA